MDSIRGFILSHFGKNYLLIFLPFFSILSIVYLVRISVLSNKITLNGHEILSLYGFFLPDILFYTLPLSFIAAITATLMKLSEENELIALFSFGLTPMALLRIFFFPALLFTLLMLLLSLYTIPQSTLAYKLFKEQKTAEAKLNIKPNRLGQKFGDYIVFLGNKQKDIFQDVVLFSADKKKKRAIIIADTGRIEHNQSQFSLHLYHGTGDTFLPEKIESLHYEEMQLFGYSQNHADYVWLQRGWSQIWSNPKDMAFLIYNLFLSLSPLLVLGMLMAFSIINPRYQKPHTYLVGFATAMVIYAIASVLRKEGTPLLLILFSLFFIIISTTLFVKKTKARF